MRIAIGPSITFLETLERQPFGLESLAQRIGSCPDGIDLAEKRFGIRGCAAGPASGTLACAEVRMGIRRMPEVQTPLAISISC
jgi:hypothetical protein